MDWSFNGTFKEVFTTNARIIDLMGGRGRGGSHFGTQYFVFKLMQPEYFRGYLMREVLSDVRTSLWQDFKDRITEQGVEDLFSLNETTMSAVCLSTGNKLFSNAFRRSSSKSKAKLKSLAGGTHVLIEECDEVDEMDFNQMNDSFRTIKAKIQILRIYNPPSKHHWLIRNYFNLVESEVEGYYNAIPKDIKGYLCIQSDYTDNSNNISEDTIESYESYEETNPPYYYTVIRGLVSEGAIGRIYKNWIPFKWAAHAPLEYASYYGIDFGFSHSKLAVVEVKAHNNKRWIRQLKYDTGIHNKELAELLKGLKGTKYADYEESKSIADLNDNYRIPVLPCTSKDVDFRIKHIQGLEVYIDEDSKDLNFEYSEYRWALDSDKTPSNKPLKKNDDLMDAFGYAESQYIEDSKKHVSRMSRRR